MSLTYVVKLIGEIFPPSPRNSIYIMTEYRWNAKDYSLHSRSQQIWGEELINKLRLKGDECILDVGCGDGKLTAEIAKSVPNGEVLGIDSSSDMISVAKNEFSIDKYPNLQFRLQDAQSIDYVGQFDIVFSNAVLHWIPDHESFLRNAYNSLKSPGRALFQMGGKGNAAEIFDVLSILIKTKSWNIYFKEFKFPYFLYSPEDYNSWLHQSGFIESRIELITKQMDHENRSDFEGWIRTTWLPYLKQIPNQLRNKFIKELTDNYLDSFPPENDGRIKVKMVRLEADLIKP